MVGQDGRVTIQRGSKSLCELVAGLYDPQWSSSSATGDTKRKVDPDSRALRMVAPGGVTLTGLATVTAQDRSLKASYTFVPEQDVALNSLHIGAEFSIAHAGGRHVAGGRPVGDVSRRLRPARAVCRFRADTEAGDAWRGVVDVSLSAADSDSDPG